MRKILRLARREYKASVKTKGFIIGLALAPVLMSGSIIVMAIFESRVDTTDKTIAVVDHSAVVANHLVEYIEDRNKRLVFDKETGKKVRPRYLIEDVAPRPEDPKTLRLELSDRIRRGKLHAFIEIGKDVLHPEGDLSATRIHYFAKNAALDDLRGWFESPINNHLRRLRLGESGIEKSAMDEMLLWFGVASMGLVSVDQETGQVQEARRSGEGEALGPPLVMAMLMFMMVMMGAMPLLSSVMEEKNQRIAEVLLGCVKPHEFMAGKLLGGIGVSLTSASVYVIGGIIVLRKMGLSTVIPYHILPWFFIFMVLNIVMMGSILASIGSTCNDAKDAQNLSFPAMIPLMIPMFVLMPVLKEPNGSFATLMSLFPPFTPMLMLLRQSTPGGIPAWQPWVGLAGMLLFTLIAVWVGGRLFRVALLMQGTPPKLKYLLRWAIKG